MVCPGLKKGHVRVELYKHKKTTNIEAHDNALACLALNNQGTRLATASEKGTIIRVWDTETGTKLQEVRRGADVKEICSICFSPKNQWLAVSSKTKTVHAT
eukprot:UN19321